MPARALMAIIVVGLFAPASHGQAVRAQPYNGQLRTDPVVGNIQGIQRYGRPLKTDPDEGEGYSYHVYPVAENPTSVIVAGGQTPAGGSFSQAVDANGRFVAAKGNLDTALAALYNRLDDTQKKNLQTKLNNIEGFSQQLSFSTFKTAAVKFDQFAQELVKLDASLDGLLKEYLQAKQDVERPNLQSAVAFAAPSGGGAVAVPYNLGQFSPYPPPFDATAGLRQPPQMPPGGVQAAVPLAPAGFALAPGVAPGSFAQGPRLAAFAFDPSSPDKPIQLYHQPLIQVRVRVVEVTRSDELQVSSILDVIGQRFGKPTLIKGNNVNRDNRNTFTGTRFAVPENLVNFTGNGSNLGLIDGSGMLVNLTTGNINYLARLLASEFHSNIITAPEVVTLNGQNVEFVAGDKLPFALGQNVVTGQSANIQQFFYKHVGTYVSVTPRIVNWGKLGDGGGKAPLEEPDVVDWHSFLAQLKMLQESKTRQINILDYGKYNDEIANFIQNGGVLSCDAKSRVLDQLKCYPKTELMALALPIMDRPPCGPGCDWHAQDCTIDLATVVRLSEGGTATLPTAVTVGGTAQMSTAATSETNVRGIANIVQVKSGHGAVMGGLIGERDIKQLEKTPILGDLPIIGFFFRSTQTQRQKTEVLVFIEAQVLDPEPDIARAQSYQDFRFGAPFVSGEFLDNPLEYGMYRAGFGTYLPPSSPGERLFWERLGRKVRRVSTEVTDMFE